MRIFIVCAVEAEATDRVEDALCGGEPFRTFARAQAWATSYLDELLGHPTGNLPELTWQLSQPSGGLPRWDAQVEGLVRFRIWQHDLP